MSGETIRLAGDPFVVRAIESLAQLPTQLPDHALVGGLAVMVRLQQAHRVTGDVDLISTDESRTIELLVATDATRTRNGVRLSSGVDLDLIDASEPGVSIDSASDDIERAAIAHQLAFAHALQAATTIEVTASAPESATTSAEIRVATAADLVVLKLHAIVDPRRQPAKRGSDAYDVARLLLRHGTDAIARLLATAPIAVRTSTINLARAVLIDNADRTAAMLRSSSVRGVEVVAADQLELLGRALADAIERSPED